MSVKQRHSQCNCEKTLNHDFKLESIKSLTEVERLQLQPSINYAVNNLEFLIKRFYYYFLQTDARIIFKDTNMEKQYKMFAISIRIILDHIDNPTHLKKQLDDLINSHKNYGVMPEYTDYFKECFLKALREVFEGYQLYESQMNNWDNIISEVMQYFKQGFIN